MIYGLSCAEALTKGKRGDLLLETGCRRSIKNKIAWAPETQMW